VQLLQEIELIYSPAAAATGLPVIIGGDFNTVANDPTSPTYPTYRFMLGNGFTDAWTKGHSRFGGATCCQEDLTVADSELTQRIDQVFTRNHITVIKSQLVGDAIVGDVGYWPSDHAAVESQLQVGSVP
jgi:endonuclease/exonuclease/phosphatase family metal-dependent hydrolase